MLSTGHTYRQQGVTLLELMIAIAILSILIAVGLPSYSTWIRNTQVRTASESIQNGLQLARTEAVRRNTSVELVLTDDAPTSATVTASTTGRNWVVRTFGTNEFIQGRGRSEGSNNTTVTGGASNFRFDGLGRLVTPAATTDIDITASGSDRALKVRVWTGGQIRMCDPSIGDPTDSRSC